MIDQVVSVPFWAVSIFWFLVGVLVGKFMFETPKAKYGRPNPPPEPDWHRRKVDGHTKVTSPSKKSP